MFDKRPENEKAIERAWNLLEDRNRGEIVEHGELAAALGAEYQSKRYYRLLGNLRRQLLGQRGTRLRSVPMVGYELTTSGVQIEESRRQYIRGTRRDREALAIVEHLPEADCSFTELRVKQAQEENLQKNLRARRQEALRMAFLMRPREQRPRPMRGDDEQQQAQAAS